MREFIKYIDCPVCGEHAVRADIKSNCPYVGDSEDNNGSK